jgi:hypothetical protein
MNGEYTALAAGIRDSSATGEMIKAFASVGRALCAEHTSDLVERTDFLSTISHHAYLLSSENTSLYIVAFCPFPFTANTESSSIRRDEHGVWDKSLALWHLLRSL